MTDQKAKPVKKIKSKKTTKLGSFKELVEILKTK